MKYCRIKNEKWLPSINFPRISVPHWFYAFDWKASETMNVLHCAIWYYIHNLKTEKKLWRNVTFSKVAGWACIFTKSKETSIRDVLVHPLKKKSRWMTLVQRHYLPILYVKKKTDIYSPTVILQCKNVYL